MRLVFVGWKHLKCIFFCEKKKLWIILIVRIYESIRFSQLLTASAAQWAKIILLSSENFRLCACSKLHHFENNFINQPNVEENLKLHRNLSLTITDKTSYDIPTLVNFPEPNWFFCTVNQFPLKMDIPGHTLSQTDV